MKIGLMGGTFNPVHIAHLRIAEEAREECGLDRIIFIPAGDPPHKPLAGEVSFERRCEMVRRSIQSNPFFELSDIEGQRPGKSYSIDTIIAFQAHYASADLFFIIGGDSFLEIGLWHRYTEIFRSCNIIVVDRPGSRFDAPLQALPVTVREEFCSTGVSRGLVHNSGHTVQFLAGCPLDVSSSRIRGLVKAGRSIRYLVTSQVEAYITAEEIYT